MLLVFQDGSVSSKINGSFALIVSSDIIGEPSMKEKDKETSYNVLRPDQIYWGRWIVMANFPSEHDCLEHAIAEGWKYFKIEPYKEYRRD